MNPAKVNRATVRKLTDLPNIGKACAQDLEAMGITKPEQLKGKDPLKLYEKLCKIQGQRIDPCMLDTFMSVVDFMDGGKPRPWWDYTAERKKLNESDSR